jgi:Na+/proline symporter
MAIPFAMAHYFPSGILGLGLTALLAAFMSGMAGNVTAFNTVWTYDIYRSYIRREAPDRHYLWMGRIITVVGIILLLYGLFGQADYSRSGGININLWWGLVMFVFDLVMATGGYISSRRPVTH